MFGKIVVETNSVCVTRLMNDSYNVYKSGKLKHQNCSAEDVIRALGHYIYVHEYQLQKEREKSTKGTIGGAVNGHCF